MAKLVKGPFTLKWGDNVIQDVEEVDVEYEVDREDYDTLSGKTYTLDGAHRVSAVITLLASDIPALAALLPQYHVNNQGTLSTGERVNNADGAIDIKAASCDDDIIYNNFDIISCGNPGEVLRINNARSSFEDIELDNKVRKVMIRMIGESPSTEAVIQMFKEGTIAVVS